jgi:hypothetical protein
MMNGADPVCEHLALDSHPASTALLTYVVRGLEVPGFETDEWGVWVTWPTLHAALAGSERAACELAQALAAIETCGGLPPRIASIARQATLWALGGET